MGIATTLTTAVAHAASTTPTEGAGSDPGWVSVLPPVVAIAAALLSRQVLPSLFLGVWVGAWLVQGLTVSGLWFGLLDVPNRWVLEAIAPPDGDSSHASIMIFTILIGGLVGIIACNGGTMGIVKAVTRWTTSRRRGQTVTGALGLVIFFDDYANTLVIGNSMRPVTDRLRISREKLAYIVDSTSAPVASLALISTWIGFEVGLIEEALASAGIDESAYGVFVSSLPYRFYPVLALLLVFAVALSGRDIGSMRRAEQRALSGQVSRRDDLASGSDDELAAKEGAPHRLVNAVVPLLVLVGATLGFLFVTGEGSGVREIVGSADSYASLIYGSILAVVVAGVMTVAQRVLSLGETVRAWFAGVKSVIYVLIVLVLAWSLSAVADELGTADYVAGLLGDSIAPWLLPAVLFVVAAATAFATGTSWGTMAILMPLAVPLSVAVSELSGVTGEALLPGLFAAVSTVLAGAVWGDHVSPISDTTVLSSLASGCDPVDHVRTQMPYAFLAGGVSVVALLGVGAGLPWWVVWPLALAAVLGGLRLLGRHTEEEPDHGRVEVDVREGAAQRTDG
ncbi:Na+/H+ antiporter NhaC family protein [Aquipuribacter nitratireducens]|uniref:Na+/H+ antiporter NhaC family protein n=1 Tax=Aquipuribacter nitratireducens TaxID=650104 RepID=A0ABW0GQX1_9MICO